MQTTDAVRSFIRLIQETRFGSIENFRLVDGQPVVDSNSEVRTEYRLSGVESAREVMRTQDYLTKPQVRTMLKRFEHIWDGMVECMDVRDGLPFKMIVKRPARI